MIGACHEYACGTGKIYLFQKIGRAYFENVLKILRKCFRLVSVGQQLIILIYPHHTPVYKGLTRECLEAQYCVFEDSTLLSLRT